MPKYGFLEERLLDGEDDLLGVGVGAERVVGVAGKPRDARRMPRRDVVHVEDARRLVIIGKRHAKQPLVVAGRLNHSIAHVEERLLAHLAVVDDPDAPGELLADEVH